MLWHERGICTLLGMALGVALHPKDGNSKNVVFHNLHNEDYLIAGYEWTELHSYHSLEVFKQRPIYL